MAQGEFAMLSHTYINAIAALLIEAGGDADSAPGLRLARLVFESGQLKGSQLLRNRLVGYCASHRARKNLQVLQEPPVSDNRLHSLYSLMAFSVLTIPSAIQTSRITVLQHFARHNTLWAKPFSSCWCLERVKKMAYYLYLLIHPGWVTMGCYSLLKLDRLCVVTDTVQGG